MTTRLDTEYEFLYNLSLTDNATLFKRLIKSATDSQIFAIIEIFINSDLFPQVTSKIDFKLLLPNPRQQIIKRRKSVLSVLRSVMCETIKCEGIDVTLTEDVE